MAVSSETVVERNGTHGGPADDVLVLPATLAQQRLWHFDRREPGSSAQNVAVRFRLLGTLDAHNVERAFDEIIRRHESLRTVYLEIEGQPAQVVLSSLSIQAPVIDLRGYSEADRFARAESLTWEEAHKPFNLAAGPMIRATLLRLEDQEHILLVTVHQISCDCWSTGLISQEFGPIYRAFCRGEASPLAELPLQYGDFALWQKQWLEEYPQDDHIQYWKRQLKDLPPLEVPTDHPRPPIRTSNSRIESILLPTNLTENLKDLSHQEECTFFVLSLAALTILIERLTGQRDVYVGTITAGRSRVELEPLIGRFINPLVVRTNLGDDPPFLTYLAQVRERVLEALDHRDMPYERVLEALEVPPDPSRNPLFQINFVHQRAFLKPLQMEGVSMAPIPSVSAGSVYDLYFFMVERGEGWRFSCEYNTDLYEAPTIQRMLHRYQAILQAIARDPRRRLSNLTKSTSENGQSDASAAAVSTEKVPAAQTRGPIGPSDAVEEKLMDIWRQTIGVRPSSVTTDFFDEGGHSVLAANLLMRIEREFGVKLSFASLVRQPTVKGLAARLRGQAPVNRSEQVHEIQPTGSRRPLWIVTSQPPLYRLLSRRLGGDQPMLGLTVPELGVLPAGFTTADIASNLIEAMRQVQSRGPYRLGGWCVSGVIVFEMARQLRKAGEHVALVAIFDAQCPPYARRLIELRRAYPARLYFAARRFRHWVNKGWRHRSNAFELVWKRLDRTQSRMRRALASWLLPRSDRMPPSDLSRLEQLIFDGVMAYEPRPCDAPLLVVRSRDLQRGKYLDSALGWTEFAAGGLEVVETPGEHGDMFREPAVDILAAALTRHLQKQDP